MKGLLTDQVSDRLMEAARSAEGVQFLKDMPCEMVFEASKGFVSYQKTASGQLPVFHLMGHVTELRGAFPYGVSSLYFDDDDKQYLFRDCLYYPNPEELTHMIQVGKYFSPQFQIPEVLSHNVYVLPVTVDLTALPPLAETSDGIHTEDSIPVLYVKLTGTGVNEKNDALLRYYGLSVDPDYPSFVLTAESSGYTDPPLMAYIPEPEAPQETQEAVVSFSDDYLTPEEEAQMQQEPEMQQPGRRVPDRPPARSPRRARPGSGSQLQCSCSGPYSCAGQGASVRHRGGCRRWRSQDACLPGPRPRLQPGPRSGR